MLCRWLICAVCLSGLVGLARAADEAAAPLNAEDAARTMIVPEGFHVTLFAGEPDVRQPINFCLDDRGRLWVAEAYSYPNHSNEQPSTESSVQSPVSSADRSAVRDQPSLNSQPSNPNSPRDRILIFEDVDGDGRFDRRTVFFEGLNYVTGVEVGFGGAWVMSPPYLLFIPDRNGDDVPDGPPIVLLDGFGNHANSHNIANGFAWGPDGWLYGTHGRTNWSLIGKPGAPDDQRTRFDGGVYRYHPVRHVWEPYADGTTNPWGIDWNDVGEAFVCNCVNPHLFHVIPGAHYEPWRDRETSRFAYERITTIADHLHFTGTANVRDGLASGGDDALGGGHAHCGTMIYLGDNWPAGYRNTVFMHNIHGKRVNNDILRRSGSGYVAAHAPDLIRSRDPWMMGVNIAYGPDGSVYISDWSDTGECHSVKNTQRETGRIFRISYGVPEPRRVNIAALTDAQLVDLQLHPNDWFVRHARRVLQERSAAGQNMDDVHQRLRTMFNEQHDVPRRLRALWALYVTQGTTEDWLARLLHDSEESIVAWAVTLLCENGTPSAPVLSTFESIAASGQSSLVRLHLASSLQRLPLAARWPLAEALVQRADDVGDQNLPLMDWYAIEPLVNADPDRFVALAKIARIPLIRRHIARRAASADALPEQLARLTALLAELSDSDAQADVLAGLLQGLEGRRKVAMPAHWRVAYESLLKQPEETVRERTLQLALIFDDPIALDALRLTALDSDAPPARRQRAVESLVARHVPDFGQQLLTLVNDPAVRSPAIRGLADYSLADTPRVLLALYASLSPTERQDVLQTLASRREWARALLDAVEQGGLPRSDLTAFTARQLRSLGDKELTARVTRLWGEVRETPADRVKAIASLRRQLTPELLAQGHPSQGRQLFQKLCANCHKLFGEGGAIGPDITGSQRRNLDYLLENILDPSASVARDFQMEIIVTDAGRVITGLVVSESPVALTVQTTNERVVVPIAEIEDRSVSPLSLMPDGLLNGMTSSDIVNLMRYLSGDQQAPLPQ